MNKEYVLFRILELTLYSLERFNNIETLAHFNKI
jgi:hypothetical protein